MMNPAMLVTTIDFLTLMCAALLVGAMFGVWLSFNPAGLDATSYVAQQQYGIRGLNRKMPILGAITLVLTITTAILAREDSARLSLLVLATICFMAAGVITRFLNQPINAIVITWPIGSPPTNWTEFRDSWWRWHVLRTFVGIGGLGLLVVSMLRRAAAC